MSEHEVTTRGFRQLDVFGSSAGYGNPLAVVLGADGLDTATMQALAHWTNLSETTFLLPPTTAGADYRVRIFTPSTELPFAGHPTLGSAAAWLGAGGVPHDDVPDHVGPAGAASAGAGSRAGAVGDGVVVQQCGAGLVPIRVATDLLAFRAPPLTRHEPVAEDLLHRIVLGLGLERDQVLAAAWIVNGPQWIGIRLADAATVLELRPDPAALRGLDVGVVGPHPPGSGTDVEVRAFIGEQSGVVEDPVTGSLNAGLAQWLIGSEQLPRRYLAAQGTRLGRTGRVHVEQDGSGTWVGGAVRTLVTGTIDL